MKKRLFAFGTVLLAGALITGLTACGFYSVGRNSYEVATELGYSGSEASWLAEQIGGSTEARRMYEEAVKDGYEGSFVDFLKEIGYTADDTAGVNAALASTVEVLCSFRYPGTSGLFGGSSGEEFASAGAGVIYELDKEAGDAYIVTNYHVVYSTSSAGTEQVSHISDNISVYLYGDVMHTFPLSATFVGGAMEEDIAVLRVENSQMLKSGTARAALAADSDGITVGERVYAVGNPNSGGISAVSGIVSVDAEYISVLMADDKTTTSLLEIRTDASINHGNSGGGLYNADGKLIGIVNARLETSGVEHFGYAIPVNTAFAVAQNVIDNSKVNGSRGALRAMLGVSVQRTESRSVYDEKTGKAYIVEKVTVTEVSSGGAAHGKLQAGDVLYSVRIGDGAEKIITRMHILGNAMYNVRKGDVVTLVVDRGGGTVTVEISFDDNGDFKLYA